MASAADPVPATLARTGSMACEPALRHFCRNIHVACSGRSDIATYDFRIETAGNQAHVVPAPSSGRERLTGPIAYAEGYAYALVRLPPSRAYFKVDASGRFSLRLYRRGTAYMAYGSCR